MVVALVIAALLAAFFAGYALACALAEAHARRAIDIAFTAGRVLGARHAADNEQLDDSLAAANKGFAQPKGTRVWN